MCVARRNSRQEGRRKGLRAAIVWAPGLRQPSDYLICKVHLNPSQILSVGVGCTQTGTSSQWGAGAPRQGQMVQNPFVSKYGNVLFHLLQVVLSYNCCYSPLSHCPGEPPTCQWVRSGQPKHLCNCFFFSKCNCWKSVGYVW